MKRTLISMTVAVALAASPMAYAASSPLAPGTAAGVKKAQSFVNNDTLLWVLGAAVVIGGIALVASGGNGHVGVVSTCTPTAGGASCPAPSTSATNTSSTSTTN